MVRLSALSLALCAAVAAASGAAPASEAETVMPLHELTAQHVRSVVKAWSLKALSSCLFNEEVRFAVVGSVARCEPNSARAPG